MTLRDQIRMIILSSSRASTIIDSGGVDIHSEIAEGFVENELNRCDGYQYKVMATWLGDLIGGHLSTTDWA